MEIVIHKAHYLWCIPSVALRSHYKFLLTHSGDMKWLKFHQEIYTQQFIALSLSDISQSIAIIVFRIYNPSWYWYQKLTRHQQNKEQSILNILWNYCVTMIQWWSGIISVFCRNPDVIFGQFEFLLSSQLNGRLFKFVKIQVSHSPQRYFAKLTDADPEILSFIIWCASTWIPNQHWTCKKADTCTVGRGLKLNEYNCPETHHMQHIDMTYI